MVWSACNPVSHALSNYILPVYRVKNKQLVQTYDHVVYVIFKQATSNICWVFTEVTQTLSMHERTKKHCFESHAVSHVVLKSISASYHLRELLENVLFVCEQSWTQTDGLSWSWTCPFLPDSHRTTALCLCCQPITHEERKLFSHSDHPRRAELLL